jgi:hypothetical protein
MVRRTKRLARTGAAVASLSFRSRYQALEERRFALQARLVGIDGAVREDPALRNAYTLLNVRFRAASLAQREAVLDSAEWLIELLDMMSKIG